LSERDDTTEQAFHVPVVRDRQPAILPVNKMQSQVREFHKAMQQPVGEEARALPEDRKAVRIELIREEFIDELIPALEADDIVETADAAIDILYVVFGLLVEMGINAEVLFDEVQRSNMSKLGEDGLPIIAGPNDPDGTFEGRVKKGPHYFRPDLKSLLDSGVADLKLGYDR
jgi:predicted HAD superfamily Cof-like phosphohydrolase